VRIGSNDEGSWRYGEKGGNVGHYGRTLQAPVGVDDELASLDVVDDASPREILVFVIGDRLGNRLFR
jgi:hypothetical protein